MRYLQFFIFLLLGLHSVSYAQIKIDGPTCVTTGIMYQYNFTGKIDSTARMEICITGGSFENNSKECIRGKTLSYVRIIWDGNSKRNFISLVSSSGKVFLEAAITTSLSGGKIDAASVLQTVDGIKLPANLICSPATGGTCSGAYAYQWQESVDNANWADLPGANTQNFIFQTAVDKTTFYRRQSKIAKSDVFALSDIAAVVVGK
jgi:hypothetical protein